jgi:murein DD-endopeptidase MepM/ murein hydrolase activator NlpD
VRIFFKSFNKKLSFKNLFFLISVFSSLILILNNNTYNTRSDSANIFTVSDINIIQKPLSRFVDTNDDSIIYHEKKIAINIRKGDTLGAALGKIRVENEDIFAISQSFKKVYEPEKLRVKDRIIIEYKEKFVNDKFDRIIVDRVKFQITDGSEYESIKYQGKYYAHDIDQELYMKPTLAFGTIENSLYNDAISNDVPIEIILSYIKLFSYDLDFQRDIRSGDKFKIFYETYYNSDGDLVKYGDLIFSAYYSKANSKNIENYRYINSNGEKIYLDKSGKSIKKSLLRTPVNGARISSGFGYRKHPILGYTKLHKGIDFAAPYGTPVYAAGSGTIKYSGWFSSYGKYVKIAHSSSYNTAYAHLSRIPSSIKKGKKVSQGDVIGYVGSTGRSTGPHLHYEVYQGSKAINPNKVKIQPQIKIKGEELALFQSHRDRIDFIMLNSFAAIEIN